MRRLALALFWFPLFLTATVYGQGIIPPVDDYEVTGYKFAQQVRDLGRHLGEDVLAEVGTPVRAIADGTIVLSKTNRQGYGQYIIITHTSPFPFVSVYGHLSRQSQYPLLGTGEVKKGRIIGYVGSKDENGGWDPHLHFAIYKMAYAGQYHYWGYAPNQTADDVDFDAQHNPVGGLFTKPSDFLAQFGGPTTGTVTTTATLDGNPWPSSAPPGAVNYDIVGPSGVIIGSAVPGQTSGLPSGQYTLIYNSGGPPNSAFTGVSPSAIQTLNAGQSITFTMQFRSTVACATPSLATPKNFPLASSALFLTVSDFNRDGKPDVVVFQNPLLVLLGDGMGGFGTTHSYPVCSGPTAGVVGDYDGDGKVDLAVGCAGSNSVSVLLGNGDGTFRAAISFDAVSGATSIAQGDFNGDGRPDLAIPHFDTGSVSILLGNGTGGFRSPASFAVGIEPSFVAVSDFNRDGKADLAVANTFFSTVSIWLGNDDGTFVTPSTSYPVGQQPNFMAVADFNGDGKPDLAVANNNSNSISILLGDGTGGFSTTNTITGITNPGSLGLADFNGDGKLDLATVASTTNARTVRVFLGDGTGKFDSGTNFPTGSVATFVAIGDLNSDGKADLVVESEFPSTVSILLNTCGAAPSQIFPTCTNSLLDGSATDFAPFQATIDSNGLLSITSHYHSSTVGDNSLHLYLYTFDDTCFGVIDESLVIPDETLGVVAQDGDEFGFYQNDSTHYSLCDKTQNACKGSDPRTTVYLEKAIGIIAGNNHQSNAHSLIYTWPAVRAQ